MYLWVHLIDLMDFILILKIFLLLELIMLKFKQEKINLNSLLKIDLMTSDLHLSLKVLLLINMNPMILLLKIRDSKKLLLVKEIKSISLNVIKISLL